MTISLDKINKITGQKFTQEDILKIDDNSTIIETALNNLPTSSGSIVTTSTTNGNIKINGAESVVYTHPTGTTTTNPHGTTATDVALGNVTNESKTTMFDNPTFVGTVREGDSTTASGDCSHAGGNNTIASGDYSRSEGNNTTASGICSYSGGDSTAAGVYCSHVIGRYNKALTGSTTSFMSTNDVFVIGNGTGSSTLSNAFRVNSLGATYGLSAFNSTGADYSEYFEFKDNNPNKEDMVGYFVTLDGEQIRKANSTDNYILGIVSSTPSIIGDSCQDDWKNKYQTDEWGRVQYQDVTVEAIYENIDDKQVKIREEHTDTVPILNPNWDFTKEYISRENRPEWSPVGMMGKLLVRDDGTCVVNGYCKSNNDGIATKSDNGYRVMKRVNDNIIQVLVK